MSNKTATVIEPALFISVSILIICFSSSNAHTVELLEKKFAELALACIHQEYPNKISHVMSSDIDARPPRELTPAFFGCFDWHSAVHGHWLLARLAIVHPNSTFSRPARKALIQSISKENIVRETKYFSGDGRSGFERPYGLAWLLLLDAELRNTKDPAYSTLAKNLAPLVHLVRRELFNWLKKLAYPIRTGEHSQTAFAFGLIFDWALETDDYEMMHLIETKSRHFYFSDKRCPLHYEPSGQDFLSPCLAEADLMRRILDQQEFAQWLTIFLPKIQSDTDLNWLPLARITDRVDGKLAHLDGLHLSRAWMLEGIASRLPDSDRRVPILVRTSIKHAEAGLSAVTGEHYSGGHWLGSFATYLTTRRGIATETTLD